MPTVDTVLMYLSIIAICIAFVVLIFAIRSLRSKKRSKEEDGKTHDAVLDAAIRIQTILAEESRRLIKARLDNQRGWGIADDGTLFVIKDAAKVRLMMTGVGAPVVVGEEGILRAGFQQKVCHYVETGDGRALIFRINAHSHMVSEAVVPRVLAQRADAADLNLYLKRSDWKQIAFPYDAFKEESGT